MHTASSTTVGRGQRAAFHLVTELELAAPFWQYRRLYEFERYSFLLDSAKDPEKLGRFSFVGGDPFLVFKAKRSVAPGVPATARIEITRRHDIEGRLLANPIVETREGDVFDDLRALLDESHVDAGLYADQPVPLLAGAVGYFGYEAGYFIEDMPDLGADDLGMPDVYFMFHDVLLAHCHRTERSFLSVVGRGATEDGARQHANRLRDDMLQRIEAFDAEPPGPEWTGPTVERAAATHVEVKSHFDLPGYCELVERCKEHIFAGDIFEVCLTHRLETELVGDPWDLYQELRRINPAPFASFLNFPEGHLISSSPERYISLGVDRVAESRPIKGTRRRGDTPADDEAIYQELFSSVKDRAENVMIVDLVRNDFGRVCKFGSVHVPELMIVEPYATVFQMVSTIRGELDEGLDALDLVRASFPGGSMTGAPKIEAMKIIDRLEPVKRGIYSGGIGYFDFSGPMDLSIVIRTLVERHGRCYFNVGGAIVADSIPQAEYYETLDKARALITAVKNLKACQK
jgi:para-aminobenzoate synthetase component 1